MYCVRYRPSDSVHFKQRTQYNEAVCQGYGSRSLSISSQYIESIANFPKRITSLQRTHQLNLYCSQSVLYREGSLSIMWKRGQPTYIDLYLTCGLCKQVVS